MIHYQFSEHIVNELYILKTMNSSHFLWVINRIKLVDKTN
ncbi:hypothetical protein XBJ2_2870018 [Xenorhabdus bovienii str. Jollieti]|uniref:Uncharacterized protein n=1 Tax=Xenorhabdus bovienii (strain SS-2004) TaxID=406818 RepID=D3V7L3_XENBS|nr:hypothetical protein XBJ1_2701 [Xenorhabdus bovienii SS-2004]CDH29517.1 hypothetical protein XBJ2_2870018 [Xenorhabdus bovienii str. Jollieti]